MAHRPKLRDLISLCRSLSTNRLSIKHNKKSHSLICPVSMLPMRGASTVVVLGRFFALGPSLTTALREDCMKWSQLTARSFRFLSAICLTECWSVSNVSKTFPHRSEMFFGFRKSSFGRRRSCGVGHKYFTNAKHPTRPQRIAVIRPRNQGVISVR